MAKILKHSNKRLALLAGKEKRPLDRVQPARFQDHVPDVMEFQIEDYPVCPACGKDLERRKACWTCIRCAYSSCGEGTWKVRSYIFTVSQLRSSFMRLLDLLLMSFRSKYQPGLCPGKRLRQVCAVSPAHKMSFASKGAK
jgi:ribosomal protein L37AE/L43A